MRVFIISLFLIVFCFSSCGKKSEESCATCICGSENHPAWLKDEIVRIESKSKSHRAIRIKKCTAWGNEIVLVIDEFNSNYVEGHRLFDCSGNCYDSNSDVYKYYLDNYDKFVSIWTNY